MNQTGINPNDRSMQIRNLNRMAFAFAFAPIIYYFIAQSMPVDNIDNENFVIMKNIFIGISIICAIAGLMVMNLKPEKFRKFADELNRPIPLVQHRMLLAMALHESIAIFSLVYCLMFFKHDFLNIAVPVSIVLILSDRFRTKLEPLPPTDS